MDIDYVLYEIGSILNDCKVIRQEKIKNKKEIESEIFEGNIKYLTIELLEEEEFLDVSNILYFLEDVLDYKLQSIKEEFKKIDREKDRNKEEMTYSYGD